MNNLERFRDFLRDFTFEEFIIVALNELSDKPYIIVIFIMTILIIFGGVCMDYVYEG